MLNIFVSHTEGLLMIRLQWRITTFICAGFPRLSGTGTLSVLLQDENDNAPSFAQNKYTFKIKENNEPGSILATLRATDADVGDNGEVRYTIAGEDAEAFTVDAITGITVGRP